MKTIKILFVSALTLLSFLPLVNAQTESSGYITKLNLEARFDAEASAGQSSSWGMHGRYFNLKMGGELGNGFSYYFRQRLRAEGGSIHFFDNTDFLYVSYQPSANWRLRLGKDAMAVGGYEYDAPPIDEYLVSEYWNNMYCFQLAASVAYITNDGRQMFVAQVSQSPYLNSLGLQWNAGLLAYNIEWLGQIGDHVRTLWSTSMIERQRNGGDGTYMNMTMLGTQLVFDRWDFYLDLMHHSLSFDDWGKNLGYVARLNYHFNDAWSIFLKSSWEKNSSDEDLNTPIWVDQMVPAGHSFSKQCIGAEFRPKGMHTLRLHGYVGYLTDSDQILNVEEDGFVCNLGLTWDMDFLPLFKK